MLGFGNDFRPLGFPGGSDGKESACSVGDPGLIPGLGSSPGEGNGNPLQYSCLENPMDGKAWQVTVHKSNKLEDVDKLPETLNLPELNQEEKKMNRSITSNEIKSVIKNSQQTKAQAQTRFTGEFYQLFKEKLRPVLLKLLQKLCGYMVN